MSKFGPKPLSGGILRMRGSRYAKARLQAEKGPNPLTQSVPRMPKWLSADAKPIWTTMIDQLKPLGILDKADTNQLGRYCTMMAQWLKMEAFVEEYGTVHTTKDAKGMLTMRLPHLQKCFRFPVLAVEGGETPAHLQQLETRPPPAFQSRPSRGLPPVGHL